MSSREFEIYKENVKRVDLLFKVYEALKSENTKIASDSLVTDILRSAVVFLHSSQEDYIRGTLQKWLIVKGDYNSLNGFWLPNNGEKKEKYYLKDLKQFEDISVKELLQRSIDAKLEIQTFNNFGEIKKWMDRISISLGEFKEIEALNALMSRRHKIVHEMDKEESDAGSSRTRRIDVATVKSWSNASQKLVAMIEEQIVQWEASGEESNKQSPEKEENK